MEKLKKDPTHAQKPENVPPQELSRKPVLPERPKDRNNAESSTLPEKAAPIELPPRPDERHSKHLGLPEGLKEDTPQEHLTELGKLEDQKTSSISTKGDFSEEKKPDLPPRPTQNVASEEPPDDPPSYSEEDFLRAQEQHELALYDLDLNASGTSTPPDFVDHDIVEEDAAPLNHPSRRETLKNAYASAAPKIKTAYDATLHFAGGLISHPVQSTKQFSILRHSHGLVAYRGHRTNVAITVFADNPSLLPPDRTIWLQSRGWSGKKGMRIKTALGRTGRWHEVTPQANISVDQVRPSDEKAWQRDIAAFTRKAQQQEKFAQRRPLETCVLRIPVAATDGYFRLVVCDARKKMLCPSPIFRVASLSASSASFRGANLRTLPLEIGIKGLTSVAFNTASLGVGPVASAIQNRFGGVASTVLTRGMNATYSAAENAAVGEGATARYEAARQSPVGSTQSEALERPVMVGRDDGPEAPYPLRFNGKVVQGAGRSNVESGLPTANLSGVREEIKMRLNGIYFGWASIQSSKTITSEAWRPALIFARPDEGVPGIAPKKVLRVFIIEDFDGVDFFEARLSVLVMGFLRAWVETHPDQFREETSVDISIAIQSLDRPTWQADATLQRLKVQTSFSDRLSSTKQAGQRQFDRIPFDKLSIRTPTLEIKDTVVGKGGLCIDRRFSVAPQ